MTLQEAKDQIAREFEYHDWEDLMNFYIRTRQPETLVKRADQAAELYAKHLYNQAIDDAANAAQTTSYFNDIYDQYMTYVDKTSITSLKKVA